jgi:hypothetical protein
MARSSNTEHAKRINSALALIKRKKSPGEVAAELSEQYGISRRQAYRYVREAGSIGTKVPIPDTKIAFTVKLSKNLITALRKYSKTTGESLSEIVTQALQAFLQNGGRRG